MRQLARNSSPTTAGSCQLHLPWRADNQYQAEDSSGQRTLTCYHEIIPQNQHANGPKLKIVGPTAHKRAEAQASCLNQHIEGQKFRILGQTACRRSEAQASRLDQQEKSSSARSTGTISAMR
jgi:hypothetical protein